MADQGRSPEAGAVVARARALAVLRVRSTALAVALLPTAVAVVLLVGDATGRIGGSDDSGWHTVRWVVIAVALLVLLLASAVAAVIARARPALSPTVPIAEETAPDLYRLVHDLADRLDVPAPSALALTPDCDSWLEDRTHPAHAPRHGARDRGASPALGPGTAAGQRAPEAPVLVIGSPFLWWMRVAELRALLAPVVAGTGPSAQPDIAAARRFVRGLDAAVAVAAARGGPAGDGAEAWETDTVTASSAAPSRSRPGAAIGRVLGRPGLAFVGWAARLLLRSCRDDAAGMERAAAAAASERAQGVDYGLRIVAQEQVGLAYAGWDRLLTRVALPAWRMGRWPARLDVGVVAALTELSRRDRLAEGFTSRLGERPACDLLEEPGRIDEATSLLAARLFHGGPPEPGPDWAPVSWAQYPEEVVDRKWRSEAARMHRVLGALGTSPGHRGAHEHRPCGPHLPLTLAEVLDRLTTAEPPAPAEPAPGFVRSADPPAEPPETAAQAPDPADRPDTGVADRLAALLTAELAREEAAQRAGQRPGGALAAQGAGDPAEATEGDPWIDRFAPLFPLQPARTGRELLADHVTAMVCCAAVDTAVAAPGLDWLDGPALLVEGRRRSDLSHPVLSLVEDGDAEPLRAWLGEVGVRPEKPIRLV